MSDEKSVDMGQMVEKAIPTPAQQARIDKVRKEQREKGGAREAQKAAIRARSLEEKARLEKEELGYHWRSVKDELPAIGVSVLVRGNPSIVSWHGRVLYLMLTGKWGFDFYTEPGQPFTRDVPERECVGNEYHTILVAAGAVTHWMPLPEAPA